MFEWKYKKNKHDKKMWCLSNYYIYIFWVRDVCQLIVTIIISQLIFIPIINESQLLKKETLKQTNYYHQIQN